MIIIKHRINTVNQLKLVPAQYGVEIDVRTNNGQLILHHDPFSQEHELFSDWIKYYQHRFLILNVKEEGLEKSILLILSRYNIKDFFFLDQSFPFLAKTSSEGESRCAIRFSEYESIETVLSMAGKIDWVWVDYFTKFPLNTALHNKIRHAGFKVCLVSPELQGLVDQTRSDLIKYLIDNRVDVDAICTKSPNDWDRF